MSRLAERVGRIPFWFHSIDLGGGVVTPGVKSSAIHASELKAMQLPDLGKKTVLDIGAWDGVYSFEGERRGAARVVALDHFAWTIDLPAVWEYQRDHPDVGTEREPFDSVPRIWRPQELPGKRGFDLAREVLGSRVEPMVMDFMQGDLGALGAFDVVLYRGVLYHMQNPLEALKRLTKVTRDLAIIETEAIVVPGFEHLALCEFYEKDELHADRTNWWVPTEKALTGLCHAAGFRHVEQLTTPPRPEPGGAPTESRQPLHYRAFVHARR